MYLSYTGWKHTYAIIIDPHLKWENDISFLIKKKLFLVPDSKKFGEVLDSKPLQQIYNAVVESHIVYGILACGGVGKTILNKVFVAQKRIIKILFEKNNICIPGMPYNVKQKSLIAVNYNLHHREISHKYNLRLLELDYNKR